MIIYQSYNDEELAALLQRGDAGALGEIYKRYQGILLSHACRRLPNQEEATDLVQELFVSLWINRAQLQITSTLAAYLYRAVRNRILNVYRHQKLQDTHLKSLQLYLDAHPRVPEEQMRQKELIRLVEQEIAALPPKMKLIFEMSRKLDMSHRQIAEELDISPHTVRTQVKSALRALRAKLGENIFFLFF
ncbi:RNA polymerase sigma-70 factor [Niabella terrae]